MATWTPKISYGPTPTVFTLSEPPVNDPYGEELSADVDEMDSNVGVHQAQYNFSAQKFSVDLEFLTETDKSNLKTFWDGWAKYQKTFDYYPSSDVGTYYTVRMTNILKLKRQQYDSGTGGFFYAVTLELLRIYY